LSTWLPASGFAQHNARPGAPMPESARARLEAYYAPLDDELAEITGRMPFWSRDGS
jgi:hypothetical protein